MLEIKNVYKTFNPGTVNQKVALNDLNLTLEDGDFVTVIGGNGAGKSTMLNAVAGVWPVDMGKIIIDGKDITRLPEHKRAAYIGRVFQDPMMGTAATMGIEENLALANRRGQRRPLDPGRDGVPVSQKLPEVRKLRILHICQPPDIPDQPVLFFLHLLRTPVKDRIPLLFRPAFPAQSLIAQRRPADGTCILKAHVHSLLLNDSHKKRAARISYGYRGSRQGLVQARTLTRRPRKRGKPRFVS